MTAALPVLPERPRPAIVIINVGTPDAPSTPAVRRYLREFLSDPRVLDMPAALRWFLVNVVITPFRAPKSAAMYQTIWTDKGSPLLVHSRAVAQKLAQRLDADVVVGMRYGSPHLDDALADVVAVPGRGKVVLVPMFPQYASASTGTALERAFAQLGRSARVPDVSVVPPFFDDAGFLDSVASTVREAIEASRIEHVLFSYHGLPLRQVQRIHPQRCANSAACCSALTTENASCYRAQCYATTASLVKRLGLSENGYSTSFQSRLGSDEWLLPNTEVVLDELAKRGIKRLAVACPSFVADCLETLEEIGVRAREQWRAAGGEELVAIPCVNADDRFVDALAALIRPLLGASSSAAAPSAPPTLRATGTGHA